MDDQWHFYYGKHVLYLANININHYASNYLHGLHGDVCRTQTVHLVSRNILVKNTKTLTIKIFLVHIK